MVLNKKGKALEGIRILDIGTWMSAPYAATLLGDFGAEVMKLERPVTGDDFRKVGHMYNGQPLWWPHANRNKKGITLDIKNEKGRDIFRQLAKQSDVIIENFRPGKLEKMGVGYEDLKKINKGIILLQSTSYGQTGPYSGTRSFDRVAQAFSGIMSVTGTAESGPLRLGVPVSDFVSGIFGAFGVMLALYYRDGLGTGEGQKIDLGLYEGTLNMLGELPAAYRLLGIIPPLTGNAYPDLSPGNTYHTKDDKWVMILGSSKSTFESLMQTIGRYELTKDPKFSVNEARVEHRKELDQVIQDWVKDKTYDELSDALFIENIPFSLVNSVKEVLEDPHVKERKNFKTMYLKDIGELPYPNVIPRLSATPGKIKFEGPRLGEHNEEVYGALLGMSKDEIEGLRKENII